MFPCSVNLACFFHDIMSFWHDLSDTWFFWYMIFLMYDFSGIWSFDIKPVWYWTFLILTYWYDLSDMNLWYEPLIWTSDILKWKLTYATNLNTWYLAINLTWTLIHLIWTIRLEPLFELLFWSFVLNLVLNSYIKHDLDYLTFKYLNLTLNTWTWHLNTWHLILESDTWYTILILIHDTDFWYMIRISDTWYWFLIHDSRYMILISET